MMSTAVTPINQQTWSPEQLKLITDVVARGATPDELKLFLYRCQNMGLDPLRPGMIHFVKYGTGPGTIVVGIEGFRSIAHRTGKLSGIKRGALRDEQGALVGGWAEVTRSDWQAPAREEAPLAEYNTGKGPWSKMPETMIKKVAEAAALRMAFPNELGGVYTKEEMDQAQTPTELPRVVPEQPLIVQGKPEESDGVELDVGYRIPFGQWKTHSLEWVYENHGPAKIASYIEYLERMANEKSKPLGQQAVEFISKAEEFLGAMELQEIGT